MKKCVINKKRRCSFARLYEEPGADNMCKGCPENDGAKT
jgi:hypothetical protein